MIKFQNTRNLSPDILNAIRYVYLKVPDALFCGSVALNALGLLNRSVKDIDVVVPDNFILDGLQKERFGTAYNHLDDAFLII